MSRFDPADPAGCSWVLARRVARGRSQAEPAAGAALIHIRPNSAVAQIRAFRMSPREKPTVLQTGNLNTLTCANDRWNLAPGMYRA